MTIVYRETRQRPAQHCKVYERVAAYKNEMRARRDVNAGVFGEHSRFKFRIV